MSDTGPDAVQAQASADEIENRQVEIERIRAQTTRDLARLDRLPWLVVPAMFVALAQVIGSASITLDLDFWVPGGVAVAAVAGAAKLTWDRREKARLRDRVLRLESANEGLRRGKAEERESERPAETLEPAPGSSGGAEPPGGPTINLTVPEGESRNGSGWNATVVAGLIVAVITGGFGIWNTVISKDGSSPDCLEYVDRLQQLDAAYEPEALLSALTVLDLGAYEQECGDAGDIIERLHDGPSG